MKKLILFLVLPVVGSFAQTTDVKIDANGNIVNQPAINFATGKLKINGTAVTIGAGTVTSVGVTTANGISATGSPVTTSGSFTFTLGAITPTTVNGLTLASAATGWTIAGGTASKTLTLSNTLALAGTDNSTLNIGTGGTLSLATFSWAAITRASGFDTFATTPSSANLDSLVTDDTGSGALVFANTPALVTPDIGAATGTSLAIGSDPADAGVLRLENAAVIGWEASPAGTDVTLTVNSSEQFVFSNAILNPTFVNPALGTPASGVATNLTGIASGLTAGTVTTNANLTGDVTSSGNAATIPSDTVTYAKMQNVSATSRLLGRRTSGAGDVEEMTIDQAFAFIGTPSQGDMLFQGDSSRWELLVPSTDGKVLTTHGAGADPTWETPTAITTSNPLTVYAAGTAYTLTGSTAALDFGTTDPVLVINQAGTYLIVARTVVSLPAGLGDAGSLSFKLRRTNNTAADVSNSASTGLLWDNSLASDVNTLIVPFPAVIYTTATTTDSLTIFGHDAGSPGTPASVTAASIVAIRLQ